MGDESKAIQAGASVKGVWLVTTKEIFVDINDKERGKPRYVYRGYVNAEGDLVFE